MSALLGLPGTALRAVARGDRRQADPAVSARHSGLAFDARYITAEPSGMGQMALELLRGLVELDTPLEMTVLVNARTQLPGDLWEREELTFVPAAWDPRGPANQVFLPRVLKRARVHALHSIDCFAPILTRRVALITNLHDLIPLVYADERMRGWKVRLRPFWKCWLKLQCRRAERIVTVSSHSAADLARLLHVDARKVRVIHNPVRDWPRPEPVARFRQRLGLPGRVISYVGRQEPYKNVVALVRAMRIVLDTAADERLRLVVAGAPDPRYPEASQEVERLGLADRVLFTGYLGEDSLGALYRTSDVFVFPSLYEGFGLPPVEAMRFGTPVVVGRRTAAPEVLGDAAYYVDPEDPRAIAGGILEILRDPALAGRLRQAGKRQAARYSAHRAARQYRHLYDEVLGTV